MKFAGICLLLAGWGIVLTAIVLLSPDAERGAFIAAGLGVEVMGLATLFRTHSTLRGHRG